MEAGAFSREVPPLALQRVIGSRIASVELSLRQPSLVYGPMIADPVFDCFRVVPLEFAFFQGRGAKEADAVLEFQHQPITFNKRLSFMQATGIFRENRPRRRGELDE